MNDLKQLPNISVKLQEKLNMAGREYFKSLK